MSSPRQEHQSFPRQEHQEIEKTFNDLHISGNTGKTVLTHNPKPQYQQQPTHNEPRQRSSPEPKNRTPFGHVVRHNYPSHYQDNHATDVQLTDYDPITRYQTDTKQNDQQMKHTTAYYADNENTTSKTTTPKLHPRTTQLTFQRYRDAPNTSVMSHSTTTSRTNENNQTQRASLLGNEGTDLGGDSPFFEYIYPKEMIIFRIYGTSRAEIDFPAKPLYFKGLKWCKISPRAIVKSSAGILSALEQWSNADFSWFQLILGWFRVGKCRFYQCCASPQ